MTYAYSMNKMRGFTIVELVVVIAIVGVLAAVTIIGYQNIQRSSANSATIGEVNTWMSLISQYKARYGSVPSFSVPYATYQQATSNGASSMALLCLSSSLSGESCRDDVLKLVTNGGSYIDATPFFNEIRKIGQLPETKSREILNITVSGQQYVIRGVSVAVGTTSPCPSGSANCTMGGMYYYYTYIQGRVDKCPSIGNTPNSAPNYMSQYDITVCQSQVN
jgi:prepilin-type N-terminal cleavage/methylation domain-containing protein